MRRATAAEDVDLVVMRWWGFLLGVLRWECFFIGDAHGGMHVQSHIRVSLHARAFARVEIQGSGSSTARGLSPEELLQLLVGACLLRSLRACLGEPHLIQLSVDAHSVCRQPSAVAATAYAVPPEMDGTRCTRLVTLSERYR